MAHLDSANESRALCSYCDTQLATILLDSEDGERELYVESGYRQDVDSVWVLGEHSKERAAAGRKPVARRLNKLSARVIAALHLPPGAEEPQVIWMRQPHRLPALIECPACGEIQKLHPRLLNADITPPLHADDLEAMLWTPNGDNPALATVVQELQDPEERRRYERELEKGPLMSILMWPSRQKA
jgi:hypothetical protein